ncbi:MAG: CoA-binding protein, partial [Flammeovirgaceae bacterium]|nr:CoA-binding protein [Flammeovirgaceae bacterium]MDW8287987.1 CoA-binding protein [Flammeovirgaceae bacterium]
TLILGASPNPTRYAYIAAQRLMEKGHPIVLVGIKKGEINGIPILNHREIQPNIDTITLYLSPENQKEWYEYILNTHPKRLIFNPGTENDELAQKARQKGIQTVEACTLVMLSLGNY